MALLIVVQCLLSIYAVGVLVELATEAHGLVCVLPFTPWPIGCFLLIFLIPAWLQPPLLSLSQTSAAPIAAKTRKRCIV